MVYIHSNGNSKTSIFIIWGEVRHEIQTLKSLVMYQQQKTHSNHTSRCQWLILRAPSTVVLWGATVQSRSLLWLQCLQQGLTASVWQESNPPCRYWLLQWSEQLIHRTFLIESDGMVSDWHWGYGIWVIFSSKRATGSQVLQGSLEPKSWPSGSGLANCERSKTYNGLVMRKGRGQKWNNRTLMGFSQWVKSSQNHLWTFGL